MIKGLLITGIILTVLGALLWIIVGAYTNWYHSLGYEDSHPDDSDERQSNHRS